MLRIRFHGRGGQGMKTASRILGRALFDAGYEVQDAPRYAAERRGAPMAAYVRAHHRPIDERGVIVRPDLVVVADDSLVGLPAAGILAGVDAGTVLLLASAEPAAAWRHRLAFPGAVLVIPAFPLEGESVPHVGVACAAAAACMVGIPWSFVEGAVVAELEDLDVPALSVNLEQARRGFEIAEKFDVRVGDRADLDPEPPVWVDLPHDPIEVAAPAIHATATTVTVRTDLWRVFRPEVDRARCRQCWWVCSTACPDGVIAVEDDRPLIDLEHCKGCMVCVAVCPHHAIEAVPERRAAEGCA